MWNLQNVTTSLFLIRFSSFCTNLVGKFYAFFWNAYGDSGLDFLVLKCKYMNRYFSSFQKSRGGRSPQKNSRGGHVPPVPPRDRRLCMSDSNPKYITFRKSKGIDMQSFIADLQEQNWTDIESYDTIDQALIKWEGLLLKVANQHMPWRLKRVRKKHSPSLNEAISKLIKERDRMKEMAKKTKKSEICWKEYKRLKNKVTLESRKSKKKYYSGQLGQCKDRNKSWKVLKSVIPNKSSPLTLTHDSDEKAKLIS